MVSFQQIEGWSGEGKGAHGELSSLRPICLLDSCGKFLCEGNIQQATRPIAVANGASKWYWTLQFEPLTDQYGWEKVQLLHLTFKTRSIGGTKFVGFANDIAFVIVAKADYKPEAKLITVSVGDFGIRSKSR